MLRRRELRYLTTILAVVFVLAYVLSLPSSAFAAKKTTPKEESKDKEGAAATVETVETPAPAETKTAPSESERQRSLINGYIAAGDDEKTIRALKDVAISSKEFSDLTDWVNMKLWRLASAKGEVQKTIEDLENAAAKDPKNTGLKRIIAGGYESLYRWDRVVLIYEDMLNINPDESIFNRLLVYYMLAGDYNKVIAKLEPIVNANPNDTYHSDILANAYVRARMETKALALYKQKIDKDPDSAGLRGRYAQAFMDFGRFQEAAKEWKRASELAPSIQLFKQKEAEALSLR